MAENITLTPETIAELCREHLTPLEVAEVVAAPAERLLEVLRSERRTDMDGREVANWFLAAARRAATEVS